MGGQMLVGGRGLTLKDGQEQIKDGGPHGIKRETDVRATAGARHAEG
jgi:hypothetical protein